MKSTKRLLLAAILSVAALYGSFAEPIGLTINPYIAMQPGNVLATNYSPVFAFDVVGMYIGYDIGLGDMGKITPGIEDYARIFFPSTGTTWQDWLEMSAIYSISAFSLKASFPLAFAGPTPAKQMIYSFYLTPCYKIALDKPMSITIDMRSWFWVFGQYIQLTDMVQLEPRIKFSYGDLYVMGRMDLKLPSFNNLCAYVFVGYSIMGFCPEVSVKFTNINPSTAGTALGLTPYFKLIYKVVL
jgi:hypothetical protein